MRTTESQLEACRRTADHLGFDVIHEFIDEAVSGTISVGSRPGTQELMANLGRLDVLLVYRLDAIVTVDLYNSARSTYRFSGEDGATA